MINISMVSMNHEIWIDSDIKNAYMAFATIDGLKSWWTSEIDYNPTERTLKFSFNDGKYWMKFKILGTEKEKKVKWKCIEANKGSEDWINTEIEIKVEKINNNIRLLLTHGKWNEKSKIFALCNSTWGNLMFSLKNYLEAGKGNPMS